MKKFVLVLLVATIGFSSFTLGGCVVHEDVHHDHDHWDHRDDHPNHHDDHPDWH